MNEPRLILYVEGPGDVVGAYKAWASGNDYMSETSVTFSSQLFQACKEANMPLYALSSCDRAETVKEGDFTVTNRGRWNIHIKKIGYELTVFLFALRMMILAFRLRPAMIIITAGVTDWAYLILLRLACPKIVPVMHSALWPEGFRPKIGLRQRVYRFVWRHCVWQTLGVSKACARQVDALAGAPLIVFKPSFPAKSFENPQPKNFADKPFRVLYAGRFKEDKGVFDVIAMAKLLPQVEFSMCGDGEQFHEVKRQAGNNVTIHGKLSRSELVQQYRDAHLVVVPTRSNCAEGFCMVVAEAALLLRPVLTSPVVPASEDLEGAVICVNTDRVTEYVASINAMSTNEAAYIELVNGAKGLRSYLLDDSISFFAGVKSLVSKEEETHVSDKGNTLIDRVVDIFLGGLRRH